MANKKKRPTAHSSADIVRGLAHLRANDKVMRRAIDSIGQYTLRLRRNRFQMLARSIISQQISTAAARAIHRRLHEMLAPRRLSAANLTKLATAELRSVGLSRQKVGYLQDLAARVDDGRLKFRPLTNKPDEEIIAELTQIKGVGRWTAQMFLMFSLGRLDIFPVDDLGVRTAMRRMYGLEEAPPKADLIEIAESWRPYASIGSWYCWRTLDG